MTSNERDDGPVVSIVLAAGGSRRLGRPKQLLSFRGRPLVRHVVEATLTTRIAARAVVLGAHAEAVAAALAGTTVTVLSNDGWAEGLGSSIRVGVRWAQTLGAGAAIFVLVDQPRIDAVHLERLVERWRGGACAVASVYDDVRGAPALFDVSLFPELLTLTGDKGAASLLRSRSGVATVPWPPGAVDIDVEADLDELRRDSID